MVGPLATDLGVLRSAEDLPHTLCTIKSGSLRLFFSPCRLPPRRLGLLSVICVTTQ